MVGSLTLTNDTFINNSASGGAGGNAGASGNGGDNDVTRNYVYPNERHTGRDGQVGAAGGDSGTAQGGAVFDSGGAGIGVTISGSTFSANQVATKMGGTGGTGGNGGIGVLFDGAGGAGGRGGDAGGIVGASAAVLAGNGGARGGAIATTAGELTITSSTFGGTSNTGSNQVVGGTGGTGGTGGLGFFNAIADAFSSDGAGGAGGNGSTGYGGAISASDNVATVAFNGTATSSITVANNVITSGLGGTGGAPGGPHQLPPGGAGGAGGVAYGGGLVVVKSGGTVNLTMAYANFNSNSATGGVGGQGALGGGAGGNGGDALGGGIAASNSNVQVATSNLDGNVNTGGNGGLGGQGFGPGGGGGNGGSGEGGGFYFNNSSATTLNFAFNNSSAKLEQLLGGAGGVGGNDGPQGPNNQLNNVQAGSGGAGGNVEGGSVFQWTDNSSVSASNVSYDSFIGNMLTGGVGGAGGAGSSNNLAGATTVGSFAAGGQGGAAFGGGLYSNSINTSTASTLSVLGDTMAGNTLSAGAGGLGGTGTTSDGGPGGNGGNAGNAAGGGLFEADDIQLSVTNSTFGGQAVDGSTANANTLVGANGGRGGNAGTAGKTLAAADGGSGGAGSTLEGAGVAVMSGTVTFTNDTIVANQAFVSLINGAGGTPGGAAGTGTAGTLGANGTANAGGYFAGGLSTDNANNPTINNVGNSIIDTNSAGSFITGAFVSTTPDVAGSFTSLGSNLLGSTTGAGSTDFNTGSGGTDQIVSASALGLGPLLMNGGPTMTDAILQGSAAQSAGNISLLPAGITNDQRGPGYSRTFNNTVSAGAFEYLPPVIISLTPSSVVAGAGNTLLTINGSNFSSSPTVSFGTIPSLTLISKSSTQLVVNIPASQLTTPGTVSVIVSNPDGSGVAGSVVKSSPAVFTIQQIPFSLNNPGSQQNFIGESVSLQISAPSGFTPENFSATGLPPGLSIDPNTGIISGPISNTANTSTPYAVTVSADDGNGDTANITFSWTIGPPLSLNNPGNQSNNEGDRVALQISAPSGYTPSGFTAVGLPPGLSINTTTGLISGQIDPRGAGSYSVKVTPSNNNGQGSVSFTWTVADTTAPSLVNPGTQNSAAGQDIDLPIQNTDADAGSWKATGLPPGLLIDANGVIFGTVAPNSQGIYAVTVSAADGKVSSLPISFLWNINGSVSPPPSPVSPPSGSSSGANVATFATIVGVNNQYPGLVQLETITVDVTSANGAAVNEGVVAIQVNGQTAYALVHHGVATATFATGLLDLNLWSDLLFSHPLTASYSDSAGGFAASSSGITLPAIWIDYIMTLLAVDIGQLSQLQS